MRRDILYPIFLECCSYTEDDFWKYIFEDLAYGICPYNTYISKGSIQSNIKGHEFSYKINNDTNPEKVYTDVIRLFNKKLDLGSKEDNIKKRLKFDKMRENNKVDGWCNVKKKSVKSYAIENYVIDIKRKFNLNISQSKKILFIISILIVFNIIHSSSIIYSKGKITEIKNLKYNSGNLFVGDTEIKNMKSLYLLITEENKELNHEIVKAKLSDEWKKINK